MLFRSVSWSRDMEPTGIGDQLEGRRYGDGFWAQHWLAFVRIAGRLTSKRRAGASESNDAAAV
jgi:hypothetical protein